MNQAKIKKELLSRIDKTNPTEVEKVERYINFAKLFYKLDKAIKQHGEMIIVINNGNEYLKPNPALAEKNKINASMLSIEKTLPPPKEKGSSSASLSDLL
ncbi:hypothetical protein SAMN02745116_01771 [Pilibacter termitis]|uniref:Terminase n=1 Tax=Pilibacter termitis TaxID=263852 RepID=A0A1T4PDF4_9ENTE|nr:P27 family phage terminase small subunit [Pilibacter termitis]SJZ89590.1 hypothetical protein SAMN02745116_01771 [Pilibacter termitis]